MDEIICDHPADCYGSIIWNITYTGQTKNTRATRQTGN